MLRKHVLFAVDPKMIERLLGAVKDLRQIGSLRTKLLLHLCVENLVRVRKVIPVGSRAQSYPQTAHQPFQAAQVRLADFSTLFIV